MDVHKIGLGTAAIGRPQYINIRNENPEAFELNAFKEKGVQILETAYQNGIRYFDTAPGYGLAEELVLEWVKNKADKSIEVATKWGYEYTANFDVNANKHEVKDHSLHQLKKQWEISKSLLPYLSTLQIHSATFETGVLGNMEVLQKLAQIKSEFGIRIGVTTTGENQVDVLKKALEVTIDDTPLFEVFQVTYNILDQSLLEISDLLIEKGKRIVIKEALANGRILPNPNYPVHNNLFTVLKKMSAKYKVGIDAIALQFCVQTVYPFKVLSGASAPIQVLDNLKATTFQLTGSDIHTLLSFGVSGAQYWGERKQLPWN